jgi:hypothetical protein
LHRGISDSRALLGKRELLEDGEHVRQHRRTVEVREPKAEIERIRHRQSGRAPYIL